MEVVSEDDISLGEDYAEGEYSGSEGSQSGSDEDLEQNSDENDEDYAYEEIDGNDRKRHKTNGGRFALPSKEEQMHLRETENLMRTNLMKLQVDEMLAEVKDETYANKQGFLDWINALRDAIPTLGSDIKSDINSDWLHKHGIKCLNLDGYESSKLYMRYSAPLSADIIGSFLHKTSTKPFLCVDIAVSMSAQCFDSKDIANHVYFDKRKLYLGVLLHQLQKKENTSRFGSDIYVTCLKGDTRKPVIVMKPSKKTPYVVRLFPTLSADCEGFPLKLSQLRATKNNARPAYWMHTLRENERLRKEAESSSSKKKSSKKSNGADGEAFSSGHLDTTLLAPTPCYNSAILEDVSMCSMSRTINSAIAACPCLRDALLLMKVWLTQREMRNGGDSMDGHEAAVLFVYLYTVKRILPQMSPLLAFTAALKFIVETKFSSTVLSMTASKSGSVGGIFSELSPRPAAVLAVVLGPRGVDSRSEEEVEGDDRSSGGVGAVEYNAFWRWSESSVEQLQSAAKRSLEILQYDADASDFAFVELFIRRSNFFQECDLYFHFPVYDRAYILASANSSKRGAVAASFEHQQADAVDDALCDLSPWQLTTRQAHSALSQALGERVGAIRTFSTPVAAEGAGAGAMFPQLQLNSSAYLPLWSPGSAQAAGGKEYQSFVTIGIVLNREKSHQRVIKGPSAEDEEGCRQFRAFWGAKTQLRRFHDGTIVEACVWGSDAHQSGHQVPRGEVITTEIINYTLHRHLPHSCTPDSVRSVCTQLEAYLPAAGDPTSGLILRPKAVEGAASKAFCPASADAATLCRRAVEAADALRSIVTSRLQGLPLPVEAFRAASPSLRYTSYFPALSHPLVVSAGGEGKDALKSHSGERISTMLHVFPVVLHMHRSGKWPAELEALRKVKTAMLIRLSENLKTQFQIRSVISREHLDVMYRGFVFRLRMFTDNEVSLLMPAALSSKPRVAAPPAREGEADTGAVTLPEVSPEADQLVRDLVIAPLHHSAVHGTHTENPCLGDTVRLLSRWVSGHLLSGHVDVETLELIAASVYLEAQKLNNHPQSATAGFLRSLRRIAEFEWDTKPLIVDFTGGEISDKDANYIRSHFGASASGITKQLPMHIVASYDRQRGYAPGYGQSRPERVVLRMLVAAARVSADQLSQWMARGADTEAPAEITLDTIMNCPQMVSGRFNAVIRINRSVVCKAQTCGHSDGQNKWLAAMSGSNAFHTKLFSNLSHSELNGNGLSLRDGNVPNSIQDEIFHQLNDKFGSYALFFWDDIAGKIIFNIMSCLCLIIVLTFCHLTFIQVIALELYGNLKLFCQKDFPFWRPVFACRLQMRRTALLSQSQF
jgi:U3 small nucleolar RNA-associated protein 22